jgi:arsenate reductase-like glutaredoxin family protein
MEIKLYASPSCAWSEKLRAWLKKHKLAYEYHDVMDESSHWDILLNNTNQLSTPVLQINEQFIVGFQEKEIKKAIEKAKKTDKEEANKIDKEEEEKAEPKE